MRSSLLELQVFYEIAMSIGNSIDMSRMLKESIKAYLQKLNFSAGAIFREVEDEERRFHLEYLYSIPRSLNRNDAYIEAIERFPFEVSRSRLDAFYESTPLHAKPDEKSEYLIFALEGFGVLLLIASPGRIDDNLIQSLLPINAKLARACIACQTAAALESEIMVRQHSEKSLAASERQLRYILESIQAGIVILDMVDRTVYEANPQALRLMGRARSEVIGQSCRDTFCPKSIQTCAIKNRDTIIENRESLIRTTAEGDIPVLKNARVIEINNKPHILESLVDLREIKRVEADKQRLEGLLQQSQKMEAIGTLAGGIAHDFNNLLTPILGLVGLCLEEEDLSSEVHESLDEVYQASLMAKDLVKQILTFAHQTDDVLAPLRPRSVIKETLKLLRSTLPASIEMRQHLESDAVVVGVPTHIQQIVMNLVANAAYEMKQTGGALTVEARDVSLDETFLIPYPHNQPGPYLKISVADTGRGIPDHAVGSIFEPYFTTKRSGEGTGLGLALVHGLVNASAGIVTFETAVGVGTRFDVYFPHATISEPEAGKRISMLPTGRESILVVDDEPSILSFVGKLLVRLGYRVATHTDPEEALAQFRQTPDAYDLIITDIVMPRMTGDRFAEAIRAIQPQLPILGITGYADKGLLERAERVGIRQILHKPIASADLAKAVRGLFATD